MKILATSDTHFPFDSSEWPEADVFIHAGDLMYTGYPDEWKGVVGSLANVRAKKKFYVPGNHDYHPQNYRGIARAELRKQAGVQLVDDYDPIVKLPNGMTMLAIPFVEGLPGWAYNREKEAIARWLDGWNVNPDIVVSHSPPYRILDTPDPLAPDTPKRQHWGSWALRYWFDKLERKPLLWFCGHIHESQGSTVVDGCHFHNVALCDRDYKHTNPVCLVEV